jgi:hypothetical protein
MQLTFTILAILLVLAVITVLPLIGRLILGPISRAAGRLKAPTQFHLSDFVWLLVTTQAGFAAVVQLVGVETPYFRVFLTYVTFAVIAIWAGAVSFLSRAGVRDPRRRAIFILLILPGTLGAMIAIPTVLVLCTVDGVTHAYSYSTFDIGWTLSRGEVTRLLVLTAVLIGGGPLLIGLLRRAANWVAAGSELDQAALSGDAPQKTAAKR